MSEPGSIGVVSEESDFTNCDLLPTNVETWPFIYEKNEELMRKNSYGEACGKWMMFWYKEILDKKWAEARQLYRAGKLEGIHSMKVSTEEDSGGLYNPNTGVIIFYCGPATDEKKMMTIGQKLLEQIPYYSYRFGAMFYKSDEQTEEGTRATGNRRNHKFKIQVPRTVPVPTHLLMKVKKNEPAADDDDVIVADDDVIVGNDDDDVIVIDDTC